MRIIEHLHCGRLLAVQRGALVGPPRNLEFDHSTLSSLLSRVGCPQRQPGGALGVVFCPCKGIQCRWQDFYLQGSYRKLVPGAAIRAWLTACRAVLTFLPCAPEQMFTDLFAVPEVSSAKGHSQQHESEASACDLYKRAFRVARRCKLCRESFELLLCF